MPATLNFDRSVVVRPGKAKRGSNSARPVGGAVFLYLQQVAVLMRSTSEKQQSCSTELFILKHGRQMPVSTAHISGYFMGPNGHCFSNATRACDMLEEQLIYCEGFACVPGLIPIHHAWLCNKSGEVFDPANGWQRCTDYLGVPFKYDFHLTMMLRTEYHGVLGRWEHRYPVERGEYKPQEFLYPL